MKTEVLCVLVALCVAAGAAAVPERDQAGTLDVKSAKPLAVEMLGTPLRTMRMATYLLPKPEDAGWFAALGYGVADRTPMPAQVYVVDLETAHVAAKVFRDVQGIMLYLPRCATDADGRYYIAHEGNDFGLWRFDPKNGELVWVPCKEVADRLVSYTLQASADHSRICIGTASGKSCLLEFDPAKQTFRNYGDQGPPRPAPKYVYYMAVGKEFVYSAVRKQPWYLVAANRETGKQTVLLESPVYVEVCRYYEKDCYARVFSQRNPDVFKCYRLEEGKATEIDALPKLSYAEWQRACENGHQVRTRPSKAPRPELYTAMARPDADGNGELWWRPPAGEWRHVKLAGIETVPWEIRTVAAMPDGKLLIIPTQYEDYGTYDPATGAFAGLGKSPLSTYTFQWTGGRCYLMGYPGSYMVEYDPARVWTYDPRVPPTQAPGKNAEPNPRPCHRWSVDVMPTHHIYCSAVGANGLVYFGAHAERTAVGGGLGWWDPKGRKAGGIREPYFLQQDVAGLCAAREGKTIVYAGRCVSDPLTNTPAPKDAKLFVLDTATKKITDEISPVPGLRSAGRIAATGEKVYGFGTRGEETIYYVVDLAEKKTITACSLPGVKSIDELKLGPDGNLYAAVNGRLLVRLNPESGEFAVLGDVGRLETFAFVGRDIYFPGPPGESTLCRLRDVAAKK